LPAFLEPSLALLCEKPPSGPQWIHEIKYDGYRIQARLEGGRVRLLTRKRLDWTKRFPTIVTALAGLSVSSALIDGEIVAENDRGIPSFSLLQADLKASRHDRLRYYAFDLLYLDGFDLTDASLLDRKSLLQQALFLLPAGSPLRYSDHTDQSGATVFAHACQIGLEGIVSKRKDLPYRAGRGQHWLKCVQRQEFIILGYVPSTAGASFVGSLALGFYEKGRLVYAGRVGTGWSNDLSRSLRDTIEHLHADRPAFGKPLLAGAAKGVRWARPELVAEIEYRG
jgi:bifunctional non-homologous end joining protein LigD